MTEPNDGGPAFPFDWMGSQPCTGDQVVREQFQGMTLRDYFAAKRMASDPMAMLQYQVNDWEALERCRSYYRWADAMLLARKEAKP